MKESVNKNYLDLLCGSNRESYGKLTYMSFKPINVSGKNVSIFYYSAIFMEKKFIDLNNLVLNYKDLSLEQRFGLLDFNLIIFVLDSSINKKKDENINRNDEYFVKEFKSSDSSHGVNIIHMSDKDFFRKEYINNILNFYRENLDTEFILISDGCSISYLKALFRSLGISLSSGNNTLKGVVNTGHYTLATVFNLIFGVSLARRIIKDSFEILTKNKALTRSIFNYENIDDKNLSDYYINNFNDDTPMTEDGKKDRLASEKVVKKSVNDLRDSGFKNESIKGDIAKIKAIKLENKLDKGSAISIKYFTPSKNKEIVDGQLYNRDDVLKMRDSKIIKHIDANFQSKGQENIKALGSFGIAINQKKRSYSTYSKRCFSLKTKNSNSIGVQAVTNSNNFNIDNKMKAKSDVSIFIFKRLEYLLKNEPMNRDTQYKIEKFIYSQISEFLTNMENTKIPVTLGVDSSVFNSKLHELCINSIPDFKNYLGKLRFKLNSDKYISKDVNLIKTNVKVMEYYFKQVLNTVTDNNIIESMLYVLCLIITFNNNMPLDKEKENKVSMTNNAIKIGRLITNKYLSFVYSEFCKDNSSITFSKFKEEFLGRDKNSTINSDEFLFRFGSIFIEIMETCSLISIKVITESKDQSLTILRVSDYILYNLGRENPVIVTPLNLPMIIKPKPYSKDKLGGYLLNDVEYTEGLMTEKLTYNIPSKILDENIIYKVVNNMMSTPFKVNKDLLDYLLENNHIHNLLIDRGYEHEYAKLDKRTKSQEKKYQEFLSQKILEEYIIEIAKVYVNVPEFYFPIKLDNRGRLYPLPIYFNYQGAELAKALILFTSPDTLRRNDTVAIEYLKSYGATCFGNGYNRKSYTEKINWVNTNWSKIIDFENNDLVSQSDNKFLFLAFCFEMRRFNTFLNNELIHEFKTYLPIQLDGTCNGFQHLALLSNETNLFETLNLAEAKKSDRPKDFYQSVIDQLIIYLEDKKNSSNDLEVVESCDRLIKLNIKRSNIKTAIMTIPYNATSTSLVEYVIKSLEYSHGENYSIVDGKGETKDKYIGWYKNLDSNGNYNLVNYNDINRLVEYMNEIIYINYPKIKILTKYLKDMCAILNELNLPVIWRLPTGLVVSQKYMKKHIKKIKPFQNRDTSISLTFTDKIKIDHKKQKTALMPNLIHSLDSSALFLLYNSFYVSLDGDNHIVNFYSVHDCYGVSAKYVENLITILKTIYIELYSDSNYIQKFDDDIIKLIQSAYGTNIKYDPKTRIISNDRKIIKLPHISDLIECKNKPLWYNSLSKSKFLVK